MDLGNKLKTVWCLFHREAGEKDGHSGIIIIDLTVRKEKVIELRRECRVLKRKHKKKLIETNECREVLGVQVS